jgi:hypothetical protein
MVDGWHHGHSAGSTHPGVVHLPAVSFTSKLFPPLRGPITVIEANQAGVVGHFWSQN